MDIWRAWKRGDNPSLGVEVIFHEAKKMLSGIWNTCQLRNWAGNLTFGKWITLLTFNFIHCLGPEILSECDLSVNVLWPILLQVLLITESFYSIDWPRACWAIFFRNNLQLLISNQDDFHENEISMVLTVTENAISVFILPLRPKSGKTIQWLW